MSAQTRLVRVRPSTSKTPFDNELKTASPNVNAKKRSRYEKMEVGFGTILATDYAVGDTLAFDFPSRDIIYAKFVSSTGAVLEVWNGTDVTNAITFDVNNATATAAIYYKIEYIRGTGRAHAGLANATTASTNPTGGVQEVSSEYGKQIKLLIASHS